MTNTTKRKILILAIGGLLAVFLMTSFHPDIVAAFQISPTPAPVSPSQSVEEIEIQYLEQMLALEDLDEISRQSLEEKLDIARSIVSERVQASANWSVRAEGILPPDSSYQGKAFPEGIFEGGEGLISSSEAFINNRWQGAVEDGFIQVFAGVSVENPRQGVLYLVNTSPDRMNTVITSFYPAEEDGGLEIVEMVEEVLVLKSENMLFCFDILKNQFVCAVS